MKKLINSSFPLIFIILLACNPNNQEDITSPSLMPEKFDFNFDGMFSPITFSRSEVDLDSLLTEIVHEIHENKQSGKDSNARTNPDVGLYDGVDIFIGEDEIVVVPIEGRDNPNESPDDDNELCGGDEGDNWKSFGTASSEAGTKSLVENATDELTPKLSSGKCMDIRIKRSTFSARVCGRIVDC